MAPLQGIITVALGSPNGGQTCARQTAKVSQLHFHGQRSTVRCRSVPRSKVYMSDLSRGQVGRGTAKLLNNEKNTWSSWMSCRSSEVTQMVFSCSLLTGRRNRPVLLGLLRFHPSSDITWTFFNLPSPLHHEPCSEFLEAAFGFILNLAPVIFPHVAQLLQLTSESSFFSRSSKTQTSFILCFALLLFLAFKNSPYCVRSFGSVLSSCFFNQNVVQLLCLHP